MENITVNYFTITSEMVALKLDPSALLVYAFIASYKESGFWGTAETIAERTGVSVSWVRHIIPKLIDKKLVIKTVKRLETGLRPCLRIENDYKIEELPPIEEVPVVMSEKKKKAAKQTEETKWNNAVRESYSEVRKNLFEKGKISVEFCSLKSALISSRLKALRERGVSKEAIKNTFRVMAQDNFCVNEINFEFEKLLSEKLFFQKYAEVESFKPKEMKLVPMCSKCGKPLNPDGLCYNCDLDTILADQ